MQMGDHDELIDQDGLYRELYDPEWAKERKRLRDERIEQLAVSNITAIGPPRAAKWRSTN